MTMTTTTDVLEFWFGDRARPMWWTRNDAFDAEIRERFGGLVAEAIDGGHGDWTATADGAVALVIVLDQFPRNIYRGTPRAFAGDARALQVAGEAVQRGFDLAVSLDRRMFLYMPFEHSEQLADQERSIALFGRWVEQHDEAARANAAENLDYARRHHEIIARFGRFPHRNAVLGRASTPEELAFLQQPNSSF